MKIGQYLTAVWTI